MRERKRLQAPSMVVPSNPRSSLMHQFEGSNKVLMDLSGFLQEMEKMNEMWREEEVSWNFWGGGAEISGFEQV